MPGIFTEEEKPCRKDQIRLGELINLKGHGLNGISSVCVTKRVCDIFGDDIEEIVIGLSTAIQKLPRFSSEVVYQAATRKKKLPSGLKEIVDLKGKASWEESFGHCITIMFPNEN